MCLSKHLGYDAKHSTVQRFLNMDILSFQLKIFKMVNTGETTVDFTWNLGQGKWKS